MAGEARSDAFMLGTATVMLGKMADLMNLNTNHSIGLVKNVTLKTTPGFTELTQGVKNTLVYSVMTSNTTTVDGEAYEYTGKNLSYALGLDGSEVAPTTVQTTVKTAVGAPVAPALTAAVLAVEDAAGFAADDFVFVQVGSADQVMVRKVTAVDEGTDSITLSSGFPFAIPLGTTVRKVNVIAVGSLADQPYLAAKIVGTMANGDEVAILLPKVRITSGLSLGFKTDNFDNIPLQLQIYDLVSTDPFYAMFQEVGPQKQPAKAMLLAGN